MRFTRRRCLSVLTSAAILPLIASAHTPFQQWVIYRRKHLLIGASKQAPNSYQTAKLCVAQLDQHLPEARARVARAPNEHRLASLLSTRQLPTALFTPEDAVKLRDGQAPFADFGPFDIRLLTVVDDYWLVCAAEFPAHHAWKIARALTLASNDWLTQTRASLALPQHPGTAAFLAGEPAPTPAAPAPVLDTGDDHHQH